MPVKLIIEEGLVPVKVYTDDIEPRAREQLVNLSQLPIIHHHVAAMPDVHVGIGATVGAVIATRQAIIPAAAGVDLGCGMIATRTSLTADQLDAKSLKRVFDQITRDVPVGREQHREGHELTATARIRSSKSAFPVPRTGYGNWARSAAVTTSSKCASTSRAACG